MAFDGVFLHKLIPELDVLIGGRISKIKQISKYEIVFTVRSQNKNHQLLISSSSNYARIHLTEHTYDPMNDSNFFMILRKHIDGGIIQDIKQVGTDRILEIYISATNDLRDRVERILHIEFMGKHSNMILSEDGKILDAIKRVPPYQNTYRTLLPGFDYKQPEQKELTFIDMESITTFEDLMQYQGISPMIANALIFEGRNFLSDQIDPVTYTSPKEGFYWRPLNIHDGLTHFRNLNELLDSYFFNRNQKEVLKQQANDLTKYVEIELNRRKNKLMKLQDDLNTSENSEELKETGDLILSNQHNMEKGMSEVNLFDYYQNKERTVTLDPLKTPTQNANQFYHAYQKRKKAKNHILEQIEITKNEIEYFDLIDTQLQDAVGDEINEIRQELEEQGYLKNRTKKKMKKPKTPPLMIDGAEVYIGKNNIQNEYLTHKFGKANDYWFHTKDIPGSHVLVRCNNLNEEIIRAAAMLAAYYSKAKLSSSVPVDYTKVRHIKKVPGKIGSFVTYTNQKTIYIDPEEQQIQEYLKK